MRIYIIGNDGITLSREAPAALNEGEVAVASRTCRTRNRSPTQSGHQNSTRSSRCCGDPRAQPWMRWQAPRGGSAIRCAASSRVL